MKKPKKKTKTKKKKLNGEMRALPTPQPTQLTKDDLSIGMMTSNGQFMPLQKIEGMAVGQVYKMECFLKWISPTQMQTMQGTLTPVPT